ncbi:MAG: nucleotidyltransferase [Anaerolineaceae bacterium 4572_32.1]|nr:MAG: nucleotidyltransferase [Anaerolineaceae bacterium 4572_32.1]
MKVIIPLAGFGKRLRPHTYTKPKPLVNVAGQAVLGHILDKLQGLDVEEIVFIVGWLGEQIEEYVSTNYEFKAHYVEQKELLGQAHAIRLAREWVDGEVLIIFVDTIFEADLAPLATLSSDGVIYTKEVEDPRRFGVVTLDEQGFITRFVEKPEKPVSNLAVIGVYFCKDAPLLFECIDELIDKDIKTQGEYFLADALQLMTDRGSKFNAWTVEVWEDCGTRDAVLQTNRYLLNKVPHSDGQHTENSIVIPPVYIHPSARVVNSIVGPHVYIGQDSVVIDSLVGPYVSLAAGSKVRTAIVQDSIINEGSHIEETMLSWSLVGEDALVRGAFERLNVGDSSEIDSSHRLLKD